MRCLAAVLLLTAVAAGCASVDISEVGGRKMVSIKNSGWELFGCVPIAAGDPARPNGFGCEWFRDTVTLENNLSILDRVIAETGSAGSRNVCNSIVDETVFFILVSRRIYHTSAEMLPADGSSISGN